MPKEIFISQCPKCDRIRDVGWVERFGADKPVTTDLKVLCAECMAKE